MINRTLVRTRVVQTLFAYYTTEGKTPSTARKELLRSFSDTYSLYMALLALVDELTNYAQEQISEAQSRARFTHRSYTPNRRFVENKFAKQLFENRQLRRYIEEQHISWESGQSCFAGIYRALQDAPYYKDYMAAPSVSYDEDKTVWRKIFSELLPDNEDLLSALDEMEVQLDTQNWTVDLNLILSFIVKTIRRFREDNAADQPLLEMFDSEDELEFAKSLLENAILHRDEHMELVHQHLKNWDADRLAYMDTIILQVALAELLYFPEIAVEVTLNEYIEIAKEYSGDKSYMFINGILNEIMLDLRRKGKLIKPLRKEEITNK
jgi:N utilization substance protein B